MSAGRRKERRETGRWGKRFPKSVQIRVARIGVRGTVAVTVLAGVATVLAAILPGILQGKHDASDPLNKPYASSSATRPDPSSSTTGPDPSPSAKRIAVNATPSADSTSNPPPLDSYSTRLGAKYGILDIRYPSKSSGRHDQELYYTINPRRFISLGNGTLALPASSSAASSTYSTCTASGQKLVSYITLNSLRGLANPSFYFISNKGSVVAYIQVITPLPNFTSNTAPDPVTLYVTVCNAS
jgi:hypothetical protein